MSRMRVTPAMAAAAKATAAVALGFRTTSNVAPAARPRKWREDSGAPKLNDNSGLKKRMRAARRS